MTDQTLNNAAHGASQDGPSGTQNGAQDGTRDRFGRLLGEQKVQLQSAFEDAKGRSLDTFGRAMDGLDGLVERAPANMQPQARSAIEAARKRPLLTTLAVAGLGILLAGAAGRRR